MKVKVESEKVGLKLNIQKTKIMAFGPVTSWEIDGETLETVSDFIFLGFKITADSNCSHEIKRCLVLVILAREPLVGIYGLISQATLYLLPIEGFRIYFQDSYKSMLPQKLAV